MKNEPNRLFRELYVKMEENFDEILKILFETEEKSEIDFNLLSKIGKYLIKKKMESNLKLKILLCISIFLLISNISLFKIFNNQKNLAYKKDKIKEIKSDYKVVLPLQNFFEETDSFIKFSKLFKSFYEMKKQGG